MIIILIIIIIKIIIIIIIIKANSSSNYAEVTTKLQLYYVDDKGMSIRQVRVKKTK